MVEIARNPDKYVLVWTTKFCDVPVLQYRMADEMDCNNYFAMRKFIKANNAVVLRLPD